MIIHLRAARLCVVFVDRLRDVTRHYRGARDRLVSSGSSGLCGWRSSSSGALSLFERVAAGDTVEAGERCGVWVQVLLIDHVEEMLTEN